MRISEELERLDQLRARGVLSQDEFLRAKARLIGGGTQAFLEAVNALRRSPSRRWIAGVCAGLGSATGTDAWIWRLAFGLLFFMGATGLVAYLLLWFFVPEGEASQEHSPPAP